MIPADWWNVVTYYAVSQAHKNPMYASTRRTDFRNFELIVDLGEGIPQVIHVDVRAPNSQHALMMTKVPLPARPPARPPTDADPYSQRDF
jgi:hypothetical protein